MKKEDVENEIIGYGTAFIFVIGLFTLNAVLAIIGLVACFINEILIAKSKQNRD